VQSGGTGRHMTMLAKMFAADKLLGPRNDQILFCSQMVSTPMQKKSPLGLES
jgi:hypothetical protein